ncbi:hypothetical protein HQ520_01930 [bacterium]|nr:hypothetical protein [bacterium]
MQDNRNQMAYLQEQESSLRDLVFVIFRHKWLIAIFFVVVVGVALVYAATAPSIYESEASLLVKIGRSSLALDPALSEMGPTVPISQSRVSEINTELGILTSKSLIESVVQEMGVERFLKGKSALFDPAKIK